MTVQEIRREFLKDMPAVNRKLHYTLFPKIASLALHASKFPVCTTCRYISPERKNRFLLQCTAYKRGDHNHPLISIIGTYDRPDGRYAISLTSPETFEPLHEIVLIYPPHFFSRYRERFLKDGSLSNDEVMETFLKRNNGVSVTRMSERFTASFAKYVQEGSLVAAGRIADGNVIARLLPDNVILMLTFLTDGMLRGSQKEAFEELERARKGARGPK